jgi:glucan phosphoethanolaminetransferase (alkaline phosphatase superfamily)
MPEHEHTLQAELQKETIELMMMLLSLVLGVVPLLGIAWTVVNGTETTVDGLFLSLILLALAGIFFLNAFLEWRANRNEAANAKTGRAR